MSSESLSCLVCELESVDSLSYNLNQVSLLLSHIGSFKDIDLIAFPECALYMGIDKQRPTEAFLLEDSCFDDLKALAKKEELFILLGSVPIREDQQRFNAMILIRPSGNLDVVYKKMHLFDIHLSETQFFYESEIFQAGLKPEMIDIKGFKLGLSICFDLRFPELYLYYAKHSVDILFVPSAFLLSTGKRHWHTLLKARAIESQSYVIAPAQGGNHKSVYSQNLQRKTFGHSLAFDPYGELLAELPARDPLESFQDNLNSRFFKVLLSKKRLQDVRHKMPMKRHDFFKQNNKKLAF